MLPLPCVVVASSAIRDEGTSCHYLAPAETVNCPTPAYKLLVEEIEGLGLIVREGLVWTTDAPYRETAAQLRRWADKGALAVEMQAASLFAFATAREADVAVVAMVSNAIGYEGDQFNKGTSEDGFHIFQAIVRAGELFLEKPS